METKTTDEVKDIKDGATEEVAATSTVAVGSDCVVCKKRKDGTNKYIVGYWHYGVILTYLSLALSVCGICFAAAVGGPRRGDFAAFFVLLAGLCDGFDGMVAKTRKNRTEDDKMFGMQIDSLCDIVSFGIAPVMIGVAMGLTHFEYCIVYIVFVLCGLVRLAYFNVDEINRTKNPDCGRREYYTGLPITNSGLAMPVFYLIATLFDNSAFRGSIGMSKDGWEIYRGAVMMFGYLLCAVLFVLRFKMFKAHLRGIIVTIAIVTIIVVGLSLIRYHIFGVAMFEPLKKFDKDSIRNIAHSVALL